MQYNTCYYAPGAGDDGPGGLRAAPGLYVLKLFL